MSLVFVYGSLMTGMKNYQVLEKRGKFVSTAKTEADCFVLYDDGDSPWLTIEAGGSKLYGELWEVDEDLLAELDEFENDECSRFALKVKSNTGSVSAYIYIPRELPPANLQELSNCDWRSYKAP